MNSYYKGLIALFLSWGLYFTYLWPKLLYRTKDGIIAGWTGVWGDWAAHFSYASHFAYRPINDWLTAHPLYYDRTFTYPFVADAISGILIKFGVDSVAAFVAPSIITSVVLLVALYSLAYYLLRSAKQTWLSVSLFFTSGGLGWLWFFEDLQATPSWQTLTFPPREATHMSEAGIFWINVVTGPLIAQRAQLLGMPIVLGYLLLLNYWSDNNFKKVKPWLLVTTGALSSLMLMIHIHSYIVLALACGIFLITRHEQWRSWLWFGLGATIPSLLILSWLYSGQLDEGFMRWYPGWLANPQSTNTNWLLFWLINWGFFLPVAAWSTWKTGYYKQPLVIAGWSVFIIANLFLFQPYDWDNSKLLLWSYALLAIPIARYGAELWRQHLAAKLFVTFMLFILMASGTLDLLRITHTDKLKIPFWSNQDLALAARFRSLSQPTDRVLAADNHDHWLATQTGRQILLGFRGWMWTYGIDYGPTEADMIAMFSGSDQAANLLKQYEVAYVVIGPVERASWKANDNYFRDRYPAVLSDGNYRIYQIKE